MQCNCRRSRVVCEEQDFGEISKLEKFKFKTAGWGAVYDEKVRNIIKDNHRNRRIFTSCMTDQNGPVEYTFQACVLDRVIVVKIFSALGLWYFGQQTLLYN